MVVLAPSNYLLNVVVIDPKKLSPVFVLICGIRYRLPLSPLILSDYGLGGGFVRGASVFVLI